MNEGIPAVPQEPQGSVQADPAQAKAEQLSADAEYLAGIDRDKLSPEDQQAYDQLVAHRKADYQTNAEVIRRRLNDKVQSDNADLQARLSYGDHNIR